MKDREEYILVAISKGSQVESLTDQRKWWQLTIISTRLTDLTTAHRVLISDHALFVDCFAICDSASPSASTEGLNQTGDR